jgi:hypothetical protein
VQPTDRARFGKGGTDVDSKEATSGAPVVVKVFMASPSDLAREREVFSQTVAKLNEGFAAGANARIEPLRWELLPSTYGHRPQDIINTMIDECDVFILALHMRWGQKPKDGAFSSYTEEEFRRAEALFLSSGKPRIVVLLKRIEPERLADAGPQLKQVVKFRKNLVSSDKLLYREFETPDEFQQLLEGHLQRHIKNEWVTPVQEAVRLPAKLLEALREGISAAEHAKQELQDRIKALEEFHRLLTQGLKEMWAKVGIDALSEEEEDDLVSTMHARIDEGKEKAREDIKAALALAIHPDIKAFIMALGGVLEIAIPRPVGYDHQTVRSMERMLEAYDEVVADRGPCKLIQVELDINRNTFETALAYERSKNPGS